MFNLFRPFFFCFLISGADSGGLVSMGAEAEGRDRDLGNGC